MWAFPSGWIPQPTITPTGKKKGAWSKLFSSSSSAPSSFQEEQDLELEGYDSSISKRERTRRICEWTSSEEVPEEEETFEDEEEREREEEEEEEARGHPRRVPQGHHHRKSTRLCQRYFNHRG
jgi:hypothetical protein